MTGPSIPEPLPDPAGDPVRVIKRYPNRKLYDQHARAFTSLARLRDVVRSGREIRVVSHDTGEDTRVTRTYGVLHATAPRRSQLPAHDPAPIDAASAGTQVAEDSSVTAPTGTATARTPLPHSRVVAARPGQSLEQRLFAHPPELRRMPPSIPNRSSMAGSCSSRRRCPGPVARTRCWPRTRTPRTTAGAPTTRRAPVPVRRVPGPPRDGVTGTPWC
jgi:hypothetical protein